MDGWAKIKPAAKHAGVSERTLRDWLKMGLRHTRLPSGTILIKFSHLDGFLAQFEVNDNEVDQIADKILNDLN
jgi:hypothetical protein